MRRISGAPLFASDSVIAKVASEPALIFGAGRALILQVAHPAVAAGVAKYSNFQQDPFRRLLGTLEATYSVVFGPASLAVAVGDRIHYLHERIVGPDFRANDPANLLWVHATLFDTMRLFYSMLVQPLAPAELDELYEQMALIAELFGCARNEQPKTVAEFDEYFASTLSSLAISDLSRQLTRDIVWPGLPRIPALLRASLAPLLSHFRIWAVGTTPDPLREQLQLEWTSRDEHRLWRAEKVTRGVFHVLPRPLRVRPGWLQGRYLLRQADRHVSASSAATSQQTFGGAPGH